MTCETVRYTCSGSVRGGCGRNHRSTKAARKCCDRDHAGCAVSGGYSDRFVRRLDGLEMTSEEKERGEE